MMDILLITRYNRLLEKKKALKQIPPNAGCKRAGLLYKAIGELLLCSIVSPPGLDQTFSGELYNGTYTYSYDALITIISLLKSYLILRIYWHYCSWTTDKALKVAKQHNTKITMKFALKAELKYRPYIMIGVIMTVTIFYIGFIIRTSEISFEFADEENRDLNFKRF